MKPKNNLLTKSLLFLPALAASVMVVRADIWLDSCSANGDPSGYANVAYNTGGGVNNIVEQDGATVSYGPDGDPGHYFFTATATAPGGNMATTNIDETAGTIDGSTIASDQIAIFGVPPSACNNYFYDTLTFHNASPNPVPITVLLHSEGTMSAATQNNNASDYYHVDFDFSAGGLGGGLDLEGSKHTNGNPDENYDIYSVSGWADPGQSYQILPAGSGLYGWDFTGTTTIQPGDTVFYLTSRLIVQSRASGAQNGSSSAAASFTSRLQIEGPPEVTFTSASGELLTGVSAVSRKTHRAAGVFDIDLPLTGNPGVECRKPGSNGAYQIVVNFANPPTVDGPVTVTSGFGSVSNYAVDGQDVTIDLVGVTNKQTINVTLSGVHNGAIDGDIVISMQVATGDVNGDGVVSRDDVTEAQGQIGNPVTEDNFRDDVTADGRITSADVKVIKQSR